MSTELIKPVLLAGSIPAKTIGEVLREAREAADLRQGELANMLGISRWTQNRLESGHGYFRMEWLRLLPAAMREPVVTAIQALYEAEVEALDPLIPTPEPPPVPLVKRPTGSAKRDGGIAVPPS